MQWQLLARKQINIHGTKFTQIGSKQNLQNWTEKTDMRKVPDVPGSQELFVNSDDMGQAVYLSVASVECEVSNYI